jgi:hypothetical protein
LFYLPEVDDVPQPPVLLKGVFDDVGVAAEEVSVDSFVERNQVKVLNAVDLLGTLAVV